MDRFDRRAEFADVPWQQGRLLLTPNTRRWSKEQRDEADEIEHCLVFAHFSESDEGRSREYVLRLDTPDEAAAVVREHNDMLEKATASAHDAMSRPDCKQCANRGKVYAMSQESSCDHCVWQQAGWRKNMFLKKEG